MSRPAPKNAILALVGPTGSGKTSLSIAVAQALGAEIISADSMQCYRGMEIGVAAPTANQLAQVPHHFVSCLNLDEVMAAGKYEALAREKTAQLNAQGKCAVVVGGSGLYISALIDGLFEGPARDPEIRERLTQEAAQLGNAALMERLRQVDPAYAELVNSPNDLVRIVRALEVYEITGRPFTTLHQEHRARSQSLKALQFALNWDRAVLYDRINRRVEAMVAEGWVEEVQALVEAGFTPQIHRIKALGFREILAYLEGEQSLEEAMEATKQHHRRYAKRQLTWFRGDKRIHWLDATLPKESLLEQILDHC